MNIEITKLIVTAGTQLVLGFGAAILAWRIGTAQVANQKSEIRIKLFKQRYVVYRAFKQFVDDCVVQDHYSDAAMEQFERGTEKIEFLFGEEIRKYHREVTANALAIRGLLEGLPCEDRPVVGGIVGYFKGSTVITDLSALRGWFFQQRSENLRRYFAPYLDYASAGVDLKAITMEPPTLPEPPLIRRRVDAISEDV